MRLQAVMETLHRQQRAKLELEQQQQQAGQSQQPDDSLPANPGEEPRGSPAPLAAMRVVAAGLQRSRRDLPSSNHSSYGEEEEEEEDEEDMMGSDEEKT